MAIGTISGSEYQTFADATTRACAVPSGTSDGDVLVAYCVLSQDDTAATAITVNSGTWDQYGFAAGGSIGRTAVLIKTWNTGDPTSFTFGKSGSSSSGTFAVVMVRVPGAVATPVVLPTATNQGGQSPSISCPAVTVPSGLSDNALVLRFYHTYYFNAAKDGTDTLTPPAGFTEQADQSDEWCSVGAASLLRGAGSQAAGSATASGSTTGAFGRGVSLVLAPAVTAVNKSGSDSGTGTESGTVTATATGSDAGTGSESGQVSQLKNGADTGSGSESGFVSQLNQGADSGTGGEALGSLGATVTAGDTGTGSQSGSVAANTAGSDAGAGSEQGFIRIPGSDSGAGSDGLTSLHATVTQGDSGVGAEGGYVETLFGDLVIALWAVHPDTGALVPLPDYTNLTLSPQRNSAGSITLDYPSTGLNFALLRSTVTSDRDLEVEIWSIGSPTGALRGYLQEASGDDVSEDVTWRFAGGFLELRMSEAVVWPQDPGPIVDPETGEHANEKRELVFAGDTPGAIAAYVHGQAQARGALTDITLGFTSTHDSNGVAWPKVVSTKFSPGVKHQQILDKLVDLGLAEWAVEWTGTQRELRLWIPEGRGQDLTVGDRPVVLRRGRNILEAPRKWSVRDSGTAVLAAGGEGLYESASSPTALARRGRRIEVSSSANNIDEAASVQAYAQQQLAVSTAGLLEVTHGIGFLPGDPRPIIGYNVGDWVYSQTGTSMDRLRIVQWTLTVDPKQNPSGTVTLNDTVQDALTRLQRRLNALQSGETVVGTSEPSAGGDEDTIPPGPPTDLVADSIAYQDEANAETYASVTVGWQPPTYNMDGSLDPMVQAAQMILARMQSQDPLYEDWTWASCPQVVADNNDELLDLYGGDPGDVEASKTWLQGYIAANIGSPSAVTDLSGYQLRYAYRLLGQVGGLPSSDPFPESDMYWYDPTPAGGITGTSYTFGGVGAGTEIRIQVRAFDRSNNIGPWSDYIEITTESDNTPPPVLSEPTGRNWFRTLDVSWDGLGSEGEPMPFDFDHAEVWLSQGAAFTIAAGPASSAVQFDPLVTDPQHVDNLFAAGTTNVVDLQVGVGWFVALRSVDRTGNASASSVVAGPFTAEQLVSQDLIDDIIDANKLGPDSVQQQHVVNGAITTAKIVDAAIVTAKIANLAVNNAKIETLDVGKVTAGTLGATVVIGGMFRTNASSSVNRVEFDNAGIRLFQGTTVVGRWQVSDASMLVTGTYQSGLSGERINILPDGTLRFYPAAGSNYSQMANFGSDVVWRGPLDGNNRSGRFNVNNQGVGMNFSAESEIPNNLRAEVALQDRYVKLIAPLLEWKVDGRFSAPDGFERRVLIKQTNSSGVDIGGSTMHWIYVTSGSGPTWVAVQRDVGLKFGNTADNNTIGSGRLYVTDAAGGAFRTIQASDFIPGSSQELKDQIRNARVVLPDLLKVIRDAPAKAWKYKWEQQATPPPTPDDPNPQPVKLNAPDRFGPVAEDLPAVLRTPFTDPDGGESYGVSLTSQIGILWGALGQMQDQQIVSTSGRVTLSSLAELVQGIPAGGTIERKVTWDSTPPAAPTGGFAIVTAALSLGGKCTAWIKTGTTSAAGCTVVIKNVSSAVVLPTPATPLTVEVVGLGLYSPPYTAAA